MTDTELDDLEAKARAATPGKWVRDKRNTLWGGGDEDYFVASFNCGLDREEAENAGNDSAFVSAANPETVLRLVAEVRRLKEREDSIERAVSLCDTFLAVKGMPQEERAAMVATVLEVMRKR